MVDVASKRHVIEVGKSAVTTYVKGANKFSFTVLSSAFPPHRLLLHEHNRPAQTHVLPFAVMQASKLDVQGLKKSALLNVGLLVVALVAQSHEICKIQIVTEV